MLSLLELCPKEVAHIRKDLLVAARHILATELRKGKSVREFLKLISRVSHKSFTIAHRVYTAHGTTL